MKTLSSTHKIDYALLDMNRSVADGDYEAHRHTGVELMLVLGGRVCHVVNGVELEVRARDVFAIHPGMVHSLCGRQAFDEVRIACAPGAFAALAPELTRSRGFNFLFSPPREGSKDIPWLRLAEENFALARQIALEMLDEYGEKRFGWQTAMRGELCRLLTVLARAAIKKGEELDPAVSRLNGAMSYMEANFQLPMTLDDLARKAGMSKSQFARLFQRSCGESPVARLIGLRLDHACRLLLACDKTVTEVAFACGFDDSNYFSRQFKKRLGVSPREYRQGMF